MAGLLSTGGSLLAIVVILAVIRFLARESRRSSAVYAALLFFLFLSVVLDGLVRFAHLTKPHVFSGSYPVSYCVRLFLFSVPYGSTFIFLAFFLSAVTKEKVDHLTLINVLAFLLLVLGSALLNDPSLPAELVIYGLPAAILGKFCPTPPRFLRFLIVFMLLNVVILTIAALVVLLPELQVIRSSLLIALIAGTACYVFSFVPIATRVTWNGSVFRTKVSIFIPMVIMFLVEAVLRIDVRPDGEFYHLYSRYNPQVIYPGRTFFFEIGLPFTIGLLTVAISLLIGVKLGKTRQFEGFFSVTNSSWLAFWFAGYFIVYHTVMNSLVEIDGLVMIFLFIITLAFGIFVSSSTEKPLYTK